MKKIREDLLWEAAEGRLSGPEKAELEQWLAADPRNKRRFEEVRALSGALASMETEMPSMRFTANVMEAWDQELAWQAAPLQTHTDKRIVYGIAAVLAGMLVLTCSLLFPALIPAGDSISPGGSFHDTWIPQVSGSLEKIMAGSGQYFIGFSLLLLMVLVERYFHYRHYIRSTAK